MKKNYKSILNNIKTLVFDFDGVFTDGTSILIADHEAYRTINAKDTYAIQLAVKKGYRIALITGGRSPQVEIKMKQLGVQDVFLKSHNKLQVFNDYITQHQLNREEVLYMGDDIPDYRVMETVGLACCPADAAPEIKNIAHYISHKNGGKGCVREIVEQLLRLNGQWFDQDSHEW